MNHPLVFAKPLTAVDAIVAISDQEIIGRKSIRADEYYFRGHYPDYPIYPGVFVVESAQQTARHYLKEFGYSARLSEVKTRFLAAVRPGDEIDLRLKCKRGADGKTLSFNGKCMKGEVETSSVRLVYDIEVPHEN